MRLKLVFVVAAVGFSMLMIGKPPCLTESESRLCSDHNPLNGYWSPDGWIDYYPSLDSLYTPAPVYAIGSAVFYNLGAMVATAAYHQLDTTGYIGLVAMMSPSDIGYPVWLKPPGKPWEGPYLVVDAATQGDITSQIKYRHEILEISFNTAQKWGIVDKNGHTVISRLDGVEVSKLDPNLLPTDSCPIKYDHWWLSIDQPATRLSSYPVPYYDHGVWRIEGRWVYFHPATITDLKYEQVNLKKFQVCH